MRTISFPTDYESIISRIRSINPTKYASTRNFQDGAVSYLSPYISRGVISLPQVKEIVLEKYQEKDCWKFFQELTWREYFQRVYQAKGEAIFSDIKKSKSAEKPAGFPVAMLQAATGITSIDDGIQTLYETGYMHNHWRMYTASLCANFAQLHWQEGARWMYYHLLDADLASNFLSWQWVAGSFSKGPYIFNQENLNKYSKNDQHGTFIDDSYSELSLEKIPEILKETTIPDLKTTLPLTDRPVIDPAKPILIYTVYNLDPLWRKNEDANRILILPASHFDVYPMSEKSISFIIALAKNIEGIQVFSGEIEEIISLGNSEIIFKEHPAFTYKGKQDERDWIYEDVAGYYPSFSYYIKKMKKITSASQ